MFYQKGINKGHTKEVFNFLKSHYMYYTDNSWNVTKSIAHNVKLYNLNLEGNIDNAQFFLQLTDYSEINDMIREWEEEHKGYELGFNGRSDGYLVLYKESGGSAIPYWLDVCPTYEDYKDYCKDYEGGVMYNNYELIPFYEVVRDFDKLCDEMRDYVNQLSLEPVSEEYLEELE